MQMSTASTKIKLAVAGVAACGMIATAAFGTMASADTASTIEVTPDTVEMYCGGCHFTNVENQNISTFNAETCDFAMVESMVPMLDDETLQALTDYFQSIEPPAKEG